MRACVPKCPATLVHTIFGVLNNLYGSLLGTAGRFTDADGYLRASIDTDPFGPFKRASSARMIALTRNASDAERSYRLTFERMPTPYVWQSWIGTAILFGAGSTEDIAALHPADVTDDVVDCWGSIGAAYASPDPKTRAQGAARAIKCYENRSISLQSAVPVIAGLGDLKTAFELAPKLDRRSILDGPGALFYPATFDMRADPRFLPLVEKLGLMDYWRATKTQPDVCETEDVAFCRELQNGSQAVA